MPGQLPVPIAQSFVVCREVIHDQRTNVFVLLGPLSRMPIPREAFPATVQVSVYVQITSGHGQYELELALLDIDEEVVWNWRPGSVQHPDPLSPHELAFYELLLKIPAPGKYAMLLLANGQEIARQGLWCGKKESQAD